MIGKGLQIMFHQIYIRLSLQIGSKLAKTMNHSNLVHPKQMANARHSIDSKCHLIQERILLEGLACKHICEAVSKETTYDVAHVSVKLPVG